MLQYKKSLYSLYPVLLILLLASNSALRGQNASAKSPSITLHKTTMEKKIVVEFTAETEIPNLLVILSDTLGNTLFLDSQYRFTGNYKTNIDLSNQKKGLLFLEITSGKDAFKKNIIID